MADKKSPNKKRKLEPSKKLTSVEDIRQSLRAQNPDAVVEALNQLRNQFTIRSDEGVIAPQDTRLLLAEQWLERSPGAEDIFGLWENANPGLPSLQVAIVAVLAVLLPLLSCHYTYHALGYSIVKSLLSQQWMRKLNSYIVGSHNELTLVTLKLLNAISGFAGGREKKSLLEVFQWEIKSLPKLLTLRRKGKVDYNPLIRPDIRTLYILFLLSFLDGQSQVKSTFLEQHRDAFLAIFKGLHQDRYLFIRHVLEVIWTNLWSDPKIKRTTKVGLFNEFTISHLLKIYDRTTSNDEDPEHIPADLVHHFLLAIMTRPGVGICFRDRGWYFREDEAEDEKGGKIYNKILSNVLKTLKVNEDSRQQELARRILEACPELVAVYWPSAQLTLEPRLSTKWIANISFFGTIISLHVPHSTFFLPTTTTTTNNTNDPLYNPTPPPLQIILSNILPSSISPKSIFTKGLLSSCGLVQHCTALTLAKCLIKYAEVLKALKIVEDALEVRGSGSGDEAVEVKEEEEGLWAKRRREVEKEVRRRVPEFQVVLGFSQPKTGSSVVKGTTSTTPDASAPSTAKTGKTPTNPVRNALLQESAQRLLLLYHMYLPEVVAEARFDVGKALTNFDGAAAVGDEENEAVEDVPESAQRLQVVQRLHVLRTLKESDQFIWTNKTSSGRTCLYALLKSYTSSTANPAIKSTLLELLSHLLSSCILFEETPTGEPQLWLTSLPESGLRGATSQSPDDDKVRLTDEAESVMLFLDDCIQRCLKTPFRYIEEMRSGAALSSSGMDDETYPSPLIMTIAEQLDAKIKAGLLPPSDILAISSFVRKVVFRLLGQVQNIGFLKAFVVRMDQILGETRLWLNEYPMMTRAVRMEVKMMYAVVRPSQRVEVPLESNSGLEEYLEEIEALPSVDDVHEQKLQAHSIIDRLRFFDQPMSLPDAKRLILAVQSHWAPALPTLSQYLFPQSGSLWENHILVGAGVSQTIPTEWLFFNASEEQLLDPDYRRCFIADLFTSNKEKHRSCAALIGHIEHRFDTTDTLIIRGLLSLLAVLFSEARSVFDDAEMVSLKELLFVRSSAFKRLAMDSDVRERVYTGFHELLQSSFDPSSSTDRRILSEISAHWLALLQTQLSQQDDCLNFAALWTKYLPPAQLLSLFDQLTSRTTLSKNSHILPLIQSTLTIVRTSATEDAGLQHSLWQRIPQLLDMRTWLPGSHEVDELLLIAMDSTLPVGLSSDEWDSVCDNQSAPFSVEMQRASSRWTRRGLRLDNPISLHDIFVSSSWTPSTGKILTRLVYMQGVNMANFETWLKSEHSDSRSIEDVATIIHAVLDVHSCTSSADTSLDPVVWMPHFTNIAPLCFDHDVQHSLRRIATSCIILGLEALHNHQQLLQFVNKQIEGRRHGQPTPECIRIGILSSELSSPLLDWALHWLIGHFADGGPSSTYTHQLIEVTVSLVRMSVPKSHQVETLLGVIVQHHLSHPSAVELANTCVSRTNLKPVVVNRYLQNILHHPQFFKLANGVSSNPHLLLCIVRLLHTLFNLHPTNTCQITQLEPLLKIYHGTLTEADLLIFSIFQLFEIHRKLSLSSLFNRWSFSSEIACSSALESLQSLDSAMVFRTTLYYPKWRKLHAEPLVRPGNNHNSQLYDPIFLLLLSHLVLSQHPPSTPFGWVNLFRTNVVGLCVRLLSSKDPALRNLGLSHLTAIYRSINNFVFQEKAHVIYIFNLLKDLFTLPTANDPPPRLPSYATLILAHALRGLFYPSNFIYPLTARFLLQRPELDDGDVPMLYSMLYSNADEWKKDRGWIIRFLADGMVSSIDWRVLKRRHGWDLLASLFQSSRSDLPLRKGVFSVMANLTCTRQAVMSMIFKSSFLTWLEMEIIQRHDDEGLKWARLLANIVLTIDHSKLDTALKGSWRDSIHRCLSTLLCGSNVDLVLPTAVLIIFKLGESCDSFSSEAQECIKLAGRALDAFETHLDTAPGDYGPNKSESCVTHKNFPSHSIHEPLAAPYSRATWLDCVTLLWRTTMISELRISCWDSFTYKLLASHRCMEENNEAQWIRRQILSLQGL